MKSCSLCKRILDDTAFYPHKRNKSGLSSWCLECSAEKSKLSYQKRKEKVVASVKRWKQNNPEQAKQHLQKYYENNTQAVKDRAKLWKKDNLAAVAALSRKRYASKIQRTPNWITEEQIEMMKEIYELAELRTRHTGIEWQVDHILPLQGKLVSGFHIPENLQVVPAQWNQSKNNSFDPMFPSRQFYHAG